eukprot:271559-Chlamydomonas_euryale.AAC.1
MLSARSGHSQSHRSGPTKGLPVSGAARQRRSSSGMAGCEGKAAAPGQGLPFSVDQRVMVWTAAVCGEQCVVHAASVLQQPMHAATRSHCARRFHKRAQIAAPRSSGGATPRCPFISRRPASPASPLRAMPKKWIPLESNPEVLNEYAAGLGMELSAHEFTDVFGLDEVRERACATKCGNLELVGAWWREREAGVR